MNEQLISGGSADIYECLGVSIRAASSRQALAIVESAAKRYTPLGVHFCNSYTLVTSRRDARVAAALSAAPGVNFADGAPVAWIGRWRGGRSGQSLRGPGFVADCIQSGMSWGARHYFYGSDDETLRSLVKSIQVKMPHADIVGARSPAFGPITPEESNEFTRAVQSLRPNYIWVGLGTPKQDLFIAELSKDTNAVMLGVGAAFDFLAGTKREAPRWLHGTGFEWVFRLFSEPKRLWRRYLIGNSTFILAVLREQYGMLRERL